MRLNYLRAFCVDYIWAANDAEARQNDRHSSYVRMVYISVMLGVNEIRIYL